MACSWSMPHARTYDAIVLRAVDIGEADRFCLLFTRERGLLALRVRGARRLQSRMGGSLLPLHRVLVNVKEIGTGAIAVGALHHGDLFPPDNLSAFFRAEEGAALLLGVLHEGEALPALFDATVEFLTLCHCGDHILLGFTFRLAFLLGLLPSHHGSTGNDPLSLEEWQFIGEACQKPLHSLSSPPSSARLQHFCATLLEDYIRRPVHRVLSASPTVSGNAGGRDGHRARG